MKKQMYWKILGPEKRDLQNKYIKLILCKCVCGTEKWISKSSIRISNSTNCGCLRRKTTTHGMSKTRVYKIWADMRKRCENPNHKYYYRYGGRGIKVCDKWAKFEEFYNDMGNPKEGMTLDRINNDGIYCYDNCRWSSREEQANNRKGNKKFEYEGKLLGLNQISKLTGIKRSTLWARINLQNLSIDKAIIRSDDKRLSHHQTHHQP